MNAIEVNLDYFVYLLQTDKQRTDGKAKIKKIRFMKDLVSDR